MRRQDHVVELKDRVRWVGRLLLQHVQPGAGDAAFLQRLRERLLIDDRTARRIDEIGGRLHQREALGVDQVAGLFRQRTIDGDNVAPPEHVLEAHQFYAQFRGKLAVGERIVSDEYHVEG